MLNVVVSGVVLDSDDVLQSDVAYLSPYFSGLGSKEFNLSSLWRGSITVHRILYYTEFYIFTNRCVNVMSYQQTHVVRVLTFYCAVVVFSRRMLIVNKPTDFANILSSRIHWTRD